MLLMWLYLSALTPGGAEPEAGEISGDARPFVSKLRSAESGSGQSAAKEQTRPFGKQEVVGN